MRPPGPALGLRGVERELASLTLSEIVDGPVVTAAEHVAAGAYLEAVHTLDPVPSEHRLLALAWRWLATNASWVALPDGSGRSTHGVYPPWYDAARAEWAAARGPGLEATGRLAWFIGEAVPDLRGWLALLPPTGYRTPCPELIDRAIGTLDHMRSSAADLDRTLALRLDLLRLDVLHRLGQTGTAERELADLEDAAQRAGDEELRAECATLRGDWLLAPMSSPLVWNYALQEWPGAAGNLPPEIEQAEQAVVVHLADLEAAYMEARLRTGTDAHAMAQLELRLGVLEAFTGRTARAIEAAHGRAAALAAAGDQLGAQLAAVHAVLFELLAGRLATDVEPARAAVRWTLKSCGWGPAFGISQIVARMGRHLLRGGTAAEAALATSRLAEDLFLLCEALPSADQARIDQVNALNQFGGRARARLLLDDVLAQPLVRPADGGPSDNVVRNRLTLLRLRYEICATERDIDGMAASAARFQAQLCTGRESGEQLDDVAEALPRPEDDVLAAVYAAAFARDTGQNARADALLADAESRLLRTAARYRYVATVQVAVARRDASRASRAVRQMLIDTRPTIAPDAESLSAVQQERERRMSALGLMIDARDLDGAAEQLNALSIIGEPWFGQFLPEWHAKVIEGRLLEHAGRLDEALTLFVRAGDLLELGRGNLRRDSTKIALNNLVEVSELYRCGAAAAVRRWQEHQRARRTSGAHQVGNFLVAFLELGRARALMDLIGADPTNVHLSEPVRDWRFADAEAAVGVQRLVHARSVGTPVARLAQLEVESAIADRQLEEVERELQTADPDVWSHLNAPARPEHPDHIIAALAPGTLMLLFTVAEPEIVAAALTGDGVVAAHRTEDAYGITARCAELVDACSGGGEWMSNATVLARMLLDPLGDILGAVERIVVVPSGPTMRIPWGLLPWEGKPLMEHRTVTVLPMARLLSDRAPRTEAPPSGPVVVGNPEAMSVTDSLTGAAVPQEPLPAAALEAACVASRMPGSVLLTGPAATESRVRACLPGAPVIHLATHGLLDQQAPLASSVLLANGEAISAAELTGLRLEADLVVLSACRTGEGPVAGDEMLGLGRGLLVAGARAAVLSLWPIEDLLTAVLMDRFYELRTTLHDDADALRRAQLWLRDLSEVALSERCDSLLRSSDLPLGVADRILDAVRDVHASRVRAGRGHPSHWAAFTFIGN